MEGGQGRLEEVFDVKEVKVLEVQSVVRILYIHRKGPKSGGRIGTHL